jgi:phosphoglycerate-specific signal transduction histidine kinase
LQEFCPQSLYDDGIASAAKIQLLSLLHEYDDVLLNDAVQLEQVLATLLVSVVVASEIAAAALSCALACVGT